MQTFHLSFPRTLTCFLTAGALLTLLLSCPAPAAVQAPARLPIDPAHLVIETVAGDYGNIYNVIQDKDGFLWLAASDGAKKYNGYETETVYSGETASALLEDSEGLIWMAVQSGLAVHDKKTGKTTKYSPNPNDPSALSGESLVFFQKTQLFAEDKDGFIWIATQNGLNRFDKKSGTFTAYKSKADDTATLLDDDIWSVLTAPDGSLWVGTATGLNKFDPKTGRVTERYATKAGDPDALHGKNVEATVVDDEGVIWVGTVDGGLNRLNPDKKTFSHFQADGPQPQRIANNFIYRLAHFNSAPDLIWISTVDGLSILNKRDNTVVNQVYDTKTAKAGGLGGKTVHTVIQDNSGIFWLVVNEHGFLQKIDPGARQFQSILRSQNPEQGFLDVSCPLRLGPDGNIWVTEVTTGIARVDPKSGRVLGHILHDPRKPNGFPAHVEEFEFEPRDKDILWVVAKGVVVEYNWRTDTVVNKYPSGTQSKIWTVWSDKRNPDLLYGTVWGEGLLKFNKKTGQSSVLKPDPSHPEETFTSNSPYSVLPAYFQTEENRIWLINPGLGFDLFDFDTGKVVKKLPFNKSDFTSRQFEAYAAFIDSKGRFWLGPNRLDQTSGKITPFKTLYGHDYPSTAASMLAEDSHGLIWVAGFLDGTLTRINPETGEIKVFTEQDGIAPGLGCCRPPVILPDGEIWMAGTGGITHFNPDRIVDNPHQAPVYITRLSQGGNPLPLAGAPERTRAITLNWNANFFEFEMAALSYRYPERNQYQYLLEGIDNGWYHAGRNRSARYSGLPAGSYTLRVRGANNDGVWSASEAVLTVTVVPPWWQTWWFRGAGLAGLLLLASTAYWVRISNIKRRQQELERQVAERTHELKIAKDVAEAANKAKSVFLSNMSHELRTPLNAVLGFSSLMRREPEATDGQREKLDIINRSGTHLLTLINDVLDMAKIEAGREQLKVAPFDLGTLVRDVADMMRIRAEQKGLSLLVDQSSSFPRFIKGDEARLRQILVNLVGNAVKYTERGGVAIRLGSRQNDGLHLVMEIEDTGIGISREDQERLFQPFVQLTDPGIHEGTGLGLVIARQFIELMGGSISVTSTPGKGSTFRVELPAEIAVPAVVSPQSAATSAGEVCGLAPGQPAFRILVVEDQRDNQLLLMKLMMNLGLEVRSAVNGEEGVAIFKEWHPHFIWMDRRMPVMDGLEATRRIRQLPEGQEVKIVAVTASVFIEERQVLLDAGMDDFVRKPYRIDDIYDCLAKHLGLKYLYRCSEVTNTATTALTPERLATIPAPMRSDLKPAQKSLDGKATDATIAAELRTLIVDDERDSRFLTRELLKQSGFLLREAASGPEALRIFEEWQPHLILMDLRMPGMDGIETTRLMRSLPGGDKPFVIALTAGSRDEQHAELIAAGCNELTIKPIDPNKVRKLLTAYFTERDW